MKKINPLLTIPYYLWIGLFVIAPVLLIVYYSFIDIHGNFTLSNYGNYFGSGKYLMMTFNSFLYAFIITFFTVLNRRLIWESSWRWFPVTRTGRLMKR